MTSSAGKRSHFNRHGEDSKAIFTAPGCYDLNSMHPFVHKYIVGDFSWRRVLRSTVIIYGTVMVYGLFFTHWQLFTPPEPSYQDDPDIQVLDLGTGPPIAVLLLPNPDDHFTVLHCHGNAEDLGLVKPHLEALRDAGFNVLTWDYRGYGQSGGRASVWNVHRDAAAVYEHATEAIGVPGDRIIVHGRSLGGGAACKLAAEHEVAGLVLESTFTSAFRAGLPFPIVPFDKFNNRKNLRRSDVQVLIIHGEDDELIPIEHSKKLLEIAGPRAQTWWVEGAGHNDLAEVAGSAYFEAFREFAEGLVDS